MLLGNGGWGLVHPWGLGGWYPCEGWFVYHLGAFLYLYTPCTHGYKCKYIRTKYLALRRVWGGLAR